MNYDNVLYLERIDTAFNQILCQSLYIPHLSHIYPTFIPYLSHIYPTFIPYLSHIYPTFIVPGLKPQPWRPKRNATRSVGAKHPEGSKGREVSFIVPRIETAALATEEERYAFRRCEAPRRE